MKLKVMRSGTDVRGDGLLHAPDCRRTRRSGHGDIYYNAPIRTWALNIITDVSLSVTAVLLSEREVSDAKITIVTGRCINMKV
jgi:hypothetical protein